MEKIKHKKKSIKYLLYFLILLVAGSFLYKEIINKVPLKISDISLISGKSSKKVSFNIKNFTEEELLATLQINVVSIVEGRESAGVHKLGSKEIEIFLSPHESKKIQEVVETIGSSWPSPHLAGNKQAEVIVIKIEK